jgi:multicomponent Na+:H+ antiporter subunit C
MMLANYIGAVILITIGFYVMMMDKNIIKIVIGMSLVDYGLNLILVSIGFNAGGTAPIFTFSELRSGMYFVDPVPQALTLTSIVIGACVTAMALTLCIKMYSEYGTLDASQIRRLRG